jgi:hypothetical protein
MKKLKGATHYLSFVSLLFVVVMGVSCVPDSGVAKKRGTVKDFSIIKNSNGCDSKYLLYSSPFDSCVATCPVAAGTVTGYHLASATELSDVKADLTGNANTSLLAAVTGSANICLPDVDAEVRPTNVIEINSDFCSCLNGKSDIINNCDSFCALKPVTDRPILYVNTTPGTEVVNNTNFKTLYGWCTNQLPNDSTSGQCKVIANDGNNTVYLDPTVSSTTNSFSVDILTLAKNRTWILKLVETKTGSMAQTKEFQINRKEIVDDAGTVGALAVTPINQYTCINWGLTLNGSTGVYQRDSFARSNFFYAANETPAAIAPTGGTTPATTICHDEILHPGVDSIEYPRLELIPGAFSLWDKSDARFVAKTENAGKLTINKIIEARLANEFNILNASMDLFRPLQSKNRPNTTAILMGYVMIPFKDANGKSYCPTSTEYNGAQPLLNILGEYMDDTEGVYLVEKEAELISSGNGTYTTLYGTSLARETTLRNYGFYVENGLKIKVNATTLHTKTVHFYWPVTTTGDALIQGTRRLYTVRTASTLNGASSTVPPTTELTTDKRLGCIPKTN